MLRNTIFAALALLGLAACSMLGGGTDPLSQPAVAQFATQVQAFDADSQAKLAAYSSGAIADAKVVGQSVCGYAAMADGLFKMAAPIMTVSGVDPSVIASETAVMTNVKLGCGVIDKADPSTPVATVATAAATVIAALPQMKAALQAGSPGLAAAATAPAPATAAPAPPA